MLRIFDSEAAALALTAQIEQLEGIPRDGTFSWGAPLKHPTEALWAVVLSDLSTALPGDLVTYPVGWLPDATT